jgi:hypothetical protein
MNESQPEAEAEYSRAGVASEASGGRPGGDSGAAGRGSLYAARMLAVAGAIALLAAEPLALIRVQTAARHRVVLTVSAGSHHSYALVPIAVLAILLAWALPRPAAVRPAAAAIILLGLASLGIALLADLPDIHRTGVVGRAATGLHNAHTIAGAGLYVETLGAVLLLAAGVIALLPALRSRPEAGATTIRTGG